MRSAGRGSPEPAPTWRTTREALAVVVWRPHLRKTVALAVVVGSLLFAINQLDVVLSGEATTGVWVKSTVTYLVPFGVSNFGILVAARRREDERTRAADARPVRRGSSRPTG